MCLCERQKELEEDLVSFAPSLESLRAFRRSFPFIALYLHSVWMTVWMTLFQERKKEGSILHLQSLPYIRCSFNFFSLVS